jgi:hypothetical protein
MNGNDILARQREALQAFRQAEALRAEQEKEARELRPKAEKEAEALHTKLNKLLAEAHQQFEQGLASLERVALARLLDEKRLWTEPKVVKADPVAELARSVEAANRAVSDLDRLVEALIRRRPRIRTLIRTLRLSFEMVLVPCLWFLSIFLDYYRLDYDRPFAEIVERWGAVSGFLAFTVTVLISALERSILWGFCLGIASGIGVTIGLLTFPIEYVLFLRQRAAVGEYCVCSVVVLELLAG